MSFSDKVAVITGASSGIGAATAVEFAKRGASVALLARRKERLEEVAANCTKAGLSQDKVLVVVTDVTKDGDLKNAVEETVKKFGRIDILINNAGLGCVPSSLEEMPVEDLDTMYNIHTRAVFVLSQLAMPHLQKTQGSIVNVSSVLSKIMMPKHLAYSVAKAGMDMLTRLFASELAEYKVRVNSVSPGAVRTEIIMAATGMDQKASDEIYDAPGQNPLERVGTPEEIAKAIVYLSSSDAAMMTGTDIVMDAGDTIQTHC